MLSFLSRLLDSSGFPPRWHCGEWTPAHGYLHILSDTAIFAAYTAIPCILIYFTRRRRDVPFTGVFFLFAAFILFCGTTHILEAIIFWEPVYRLSGLVKALTATVSVATAVALVPIVPKALALRSPDALAKEVATRTQALRDSELALQRANHALQAKNDEVEQFVYAVSHDLKNPLVTIQGFVQALEEDLESGDQPAVLDDLARVKRATQRTGAMIDDLLLLSRLGRVPHKPTMIDGHRLTEEVVALLVQQIEDVQARVEVLPSLGTIYADRSGFVRIVDNLLTNSLKHACRQPGAPIEIGATVLEGETRLYVRDEGPGVEREDQERIFKLFERSQTSVPGSGVGLAIVARIAQNHGGRAWVESEPGHGATFWVAFPQARDDDHE